MIIFYERDTGNIVGTINGRVHGNDELNMWVGNRNTTDRLVCQWEKNKDGNYEPSIQKEIFNQLDSREKKPRDFKVNIETKELELL